jgi:UDP-arabinose 4-epimerase
VVLDFCSKDATVATAESLGGRVYQRAFDSFSEQRNFALRHIDLKHERVLHLDADEIVTPELRDEMFQAIAAERYGAYRIPSKLMFFGQWLCYSGLYPSYHVRLGHRQRFRFKQVGHGQREAIAAERIGTLSQPYLHYNFSKGMNRVNEVKEEYPMSSHDPQVILVTGGAGYIGSHACKALSGASYQPITCDNLVYGHPWAVKWGPLEKGDIADRRWLDSLIARYQPNAIMHFAAYAYVGESVQDPGKYYRNNVAGALTLLEAARDHGLGQFIFSSTCATYGVPEHTPIVEESPQQPINPYGASKLMIERMLADFERAHGLRYVSLRYFNAAGADPGSEIGEDHDPETHLIPLAIQAVLGRGPELAVFGTDYPTPDGTAIRDYVHVADLADAHVRALTYLGNQGDSITVNLGTGAGHSVRQVIQAIERIAGRPVPVREATRRPGDPPVLVAAPGRAMDLLEWQPVHSDLAQVVETAWRWHVSHP